MDFRGSFFSRIAVRKLLLERKRFILEEEAAKNLILQAIRWHRLFEVDLQLQLDRSLGLIVQSGIQSADRLPFQNDTLEMLSKAGLSNSTPSNSAKSQAAYLFDAPGGIVPPENLKLCDTPPRQAGFSND
ncbi:MAG: hypothetical protein ACLQBD_01690 [Syntrophobacteraceae bacterium]